MYIAWHYKHWELFIAFYFSPEKLISIDELSVLRKKTLSCICMLFYIYDNKTISCFNNVWFLYELCVVMGLKKNWVFKITKSRLIIIISKNVRV